MHENHDFQGNCTAVVLDNTTTEFQHQAPDTVTQTEEVCL